MSRWNAYLNSGKEIVEKYDGSIPLSAWIKDFFRLHKQMGSSDRKIISHLAYSFYRLGHSTPLLILADRLLIGLFLCNKSSYVLLDYFKPAWNNNIHQSSQEKITFLQQEGITLLPASIFPWQIELSNEVDKELFNLSHLLQPDLFLRIRPKNEKVVIDKLTEANVTFTSDFDSCFRFTNATKADEILLIDEEVVIQDCNSQRVGSFFSLQNLDSAAQYPSVWDCCAGSGGKSIMAYDLNPNIRLTVSDSRASIIHNLRRRFQTAGISKYYSFVTDLSSAQSDLPTGKFDCIIADVPCSGSGTWSRTPEQLYFFDQHKIKYYSDLQKKIVSRIIPKLNHSGILVYITCSVFKAENEEVINFIQQNFKLQVEKMEILAGYEMKADSMFVAVLKKG